MMGDDVAFSNDPKTSAQRSIVMAAMAARRAAPAGLACQLLVATVLVLTHPLLCGAQGCVDPTCSGHGHCVDGACSCLPGYDPPGCLKALPCPAGAGDAPCSSRGMCRAGQCYCAPGFAGPDCGVAEKCPGATACSGHGICKYGKCFCEPNRGGTDCSEVLLACPSGGDVSAVCGGNGVCAVSQGRCLCDPGFSGGALSDDRHDAHPLALCFLGLLLSLLIFSLPLSPPIPPIQVGPARP